MSDIAIQIKGLSKQYRIGEARAGYKTIRETIIGALKSPFRRAKSNASNGEGKFWALKDVNLEVAQGEVVGIIGRNGAGKSTLLKVLSRITDPTEGEVEINGRVGSLLEVGTGFHPELTGRENVYLNGAILGMKRGEIAGKFDEIVAFAEIDKFLDTPVKYYSSGMYMRMAFAVAAHLEPEILVVDEVLAVGDMQFQKKCLGKMESVAAGGRTVFFVSHNIGAVRALCKRAVWLERGRVKMVGDAEEVTGKYMAGDLADTGEEINATQHLRGTGDVLIDRAQTLDGTGTSKTSFLIGEPIVVKLRYAAKRPAAGTFWIFVTSADGIVILSTFQKDQSEPKELQHGSVTVRITRPDVSSRRATRYPAGIMGGGDMIDWVDSATRFEILPQFNDGKPFDHRYGIVTMPLEWTMET